MATIQDVARHAHVGVGTVSRVLSGNGYVKEETRQRVQSSIKELNYTPNEMARNLFFQKSGIVAVIVPEVAHPFFAQFVNAAESLLCEKGYQTMICNTYSEQNYEQRYLEMLKQRRVDGIIFGAHTALDISQYENIELPIVALDRDLGNHIPYISVDHRAGGRMAAEELIRSGCRNVVQFIGVKNEEEISSPSSERHDVFSETMRQHGVKCTSLRIKWISADISYYQTEAAKLLEEYPDVDGIFATDLMSMAILQSALLHRKRVPEELKLVAYDGTYAIGFVYPRITTIVQPIERLAREAVHLVTDLIGGKTIENKKVELQAVLRPGDTTLGE
ncbi:MAG: LacI family DNA-binding transcriptional regulator [Lachnospiraceae bacterium]|nr:LacI family DNA-binding transcriptional regulator [Lachnospiraceae bacterium]